MTTNSNTKTAVKSYISVKTTDKNNAGYPVSVIVGSVVAAGSILNGFELKYDKTDINMNKINELISQNKIKTNDYGNTRSIQFQTFLNPKFEQQMNDLLDYKLSQQEAA